MPYRMPKFTALARRRISSVTRLGSDTEHLRRGHAMDVLPARNAAVQLLVAAEVREHPQLDLRIVGGQEHPQPSSGTNAERMRRPIAVRAGMFWRFGSEDDSRPVAAPVGW